VDTGHQARWTLTYPRRLYMTRRLQHHGVGQYFLRMLAVGVFAQAPGTRRVWLQFSIGQLPRPRAR